LEAERRCGETKIVKGGEDEEDNGTSERARFTSKRYPDGR
jgi:hypothetical protein